MASYEKTLGDFRNDLSIKQISGVSSSSDQFVAYLNEVQQSLANRGGWFDLEQRITFKIRGTTLVWPSFVGTVLAVRFCGGLATMSNQWFSFLNNGGSGAWRADYGFGGSYGLNGFGNGYGAWYGGGAWLGDGSGTGKNGVVIEDDGTRPIYQPIANQQGMLIRYVVVNKNDYGKTITLFGKQYGGQPLQEQDPDVTTPSTVNGLTLTAIKPYAQSPVFITHIESITREPTEGPAYLYGYDPVLNIQLDLGSYLPNETNPRWRASRIVNMPRRNPTNSNGDCTNNGEECLTNIEALIKCKLLPVMSDRDFLPISNVRAIKLGIQAVILEQDNNDVQANVKWAEAIAELNREQGDKQPARNAPIRVNLGRKLFSPI
jgi:hypothetical protein